LREKNLKIRPQHSSTDKRPKAGFIKIHFRIFSNSKAFSKNEAENLGASKKCD